MFGIIDTIFKIILFYFKNIKDEVIYSDKKTITLVITISQ